MCSGRLFHRLHPVVQDRLKRNIESEVAAPRNAATQQVAEWLKNLGMSEYAEYFDDNDVDLSVLRFLTRFNVCRTCA
jgi:SAM domain (Sterile alpha motif)